MQQEKESLINSFGGCSPCVNRRFAEHASEPQKSELKTLMKSEETPEGFFKFRLFSDLARSIRENFFGPLKYTDGFDSRFVEDYESRLDGNANAKVD